MTATVQAVSTTSRLSESECDPVFTSVNVYGHTQQFTHNMSQHVILIITHEEHDQP